MGHGAHGGRGAGDYLGTSEGYMANVWPMQQSAPATPQANAQTREQTREQIQEQAQAAREAAQTARQLAHTARDLARAQGQAIEEQIRAATQDIAQQGGPIIIQPRPPFQDEVIPRQVVELSIVLFSILALIIITWPIMRAFARRLDRAAVPPASNPELTAQLQRIEQGVDAMSIEVERISEAQRYMARLQTEQNADAPAIAPRSKMS